ncbi:hypothetical protein [Clostridium sp. OS1-26]|uniref:hypothetical protein n=1 Tax=Clostridium sp. OS1-26 TaxID=3070681 RepID=UPI0027E00F42|nr:hypothetical protein [Clostridium sp. OS1-26]WML34351.1 hypothetical protein RCG18_24170 [Clostridium sp. OS1-26]
MNAIKIVTFFSPNRWKEVLYSNMGKIKLDDKHAIGNFIGGYKKLFNLIMKQLFNLMCGILPSSIGGRWIALADRQQV